MNYILLSGDYNQIYGGFSNVIRNLSLESDIDIDLIIELIDNSRKYLETLSKIIDKVEEVENENNNN